MGDETYFLRVEALMPPPIDSWAPSTPRIGGFFLAVEGKRHAECLCKLLFKSYRHGQLPRCHSPTFSSTRKGSLDADEQIVIEEGIDVVSRMAEEPEGSAFDDVESSFPSIMRADLLRTCCIRATRLNEVTASEQTQGGLASEATLPETTDEAQGRSPGATVQPAAHRVPAREPNEGTEQPIIDALFESGGVSLNALKAIPKAKRPTGQWLAPRAIGRECDGQFKATLKHMIDLGWLDNGRNHGLRSGYFLTEAGLKLANRKSGPGQD